MKIQQIANTSINTRGNRQGNSVTFSGITMASQNKGMPKFGGIIPASVNNNQKTLWQEFKSLLSDTFGAVKNSYEKSELKRILVNPIANKIDKITLNSPKLAQAVKGAVLFTAGVGLYECVTREFEKY